MRDLNAAKDWENLQVLERGRTASRAYFVPFPEASAALGYDRGSSPWFKSLNGVWKFKYAAGPELARKNFTKATQSAHGTTFGCRDFGSCKATAARIIRIWIIRFPSILRMCQAIIRRAAMFGSSSCRSLGTEGGLRLNSTAWTARSISGLTAGLSDTVKAAV